MPETIADLIARLEADIARSGAVVNADVSRVYERDGWFRVAVAVEGEARTMAWQPKFRRRGLAIDYREAALEVLGRAT